MSILLAFAMGVLGRQTPVPASRNIVTSGGVPVTSGGVVVTSGS